MAHIWAVAYMVTDGGGEGLLYINRGMRFKGKSTLCYSIDLNRAVNIMYKSQNVEKQDFSQWCNQIICSAALPTDSSYYI